MQETVDIMAEYRRNLESVLRKLMLQAWQICARQLFAAADPAKFIGDGASGIIADATLGLDPKVMGDSDLLHTISTYGSVVTWPSTTLWSCSRASSRRF